MTSPWGNPPQLPTGPRTAGDVFTVQLKPCCGEVLLGEECDCAALWAELATAPVVQLPPHLPGLLPLTDRALGGVA